MGKQTGLVKRGKGYSLRVVVPKELWATFTPIWDRERRAAPTRRKGTEVRQVWIPLDEADRRKATERANLKKVWLDGLFREARAALSDAPTATLSSVPNQDAIHRAVRSYFYQLERSASPIPLDPFARDDAVERAIDEAVAVHGTPADDRTVQRVANTVVAEANLSIPPSSPLFSDLVEAVKAALDEHHTREVERLSLQPIAHRHPLFADVGPDRPPAKTMTLSDAVEAFQGAPERSNRAVKTKSAWRFRLAVWLDLLGPAKLVAAITRAEVKVARDTLMALPANAVKRWPGQPLAKVAEMARCKGIPPMHPKSVQLYVDALASLLKWLVNEGEIAGNPATGIGGPGVQNGAERARRPMTITELQTLFASGPYADPTASRGWRFWLPLIGLFHGMRLAEILGLRAEDVAERDGIPCFIIRANPGRSLNSPLKKSPFICTGQAEG